MDAQFCMKLHFLGRLGFLESLIIHINTVLYDGCEFYDHVSVC